MSILRTFVTGLAALFLQLGAANAGGISTPILFLSNNTTQVVCIANNVTASATLSVTVKIIGIVSGGSTDTCSLPATDRGGCQVVFSGAGQCRISIAGFTNQQVRDSVRGVMFTRPITAPFALEAVVQAQ